jgi:hypothetical protein
MAGRLIHVIGGYANLSPCNSRLSLLSYKRNSVSREAPA